MKNADLFRHESDYQDLNADQAVVHLSQALQFKTISYLDTSRIDYSQFKALHRYIQESYPCVMDHCIFEVVDHSILITLPGTDAALKPALFMAHMDVVPVVAGTEKDWTHDPFSGDVSDGYIWGRGALDIKQMMIGILESAEYLLRHQRTFRRTVYFAFGQDEETCSSGNIAISNLLKKRGVELEFVMDEGAGDVMDASDYGAPGTLISTIGVYEKGYLDMSLSVKARGGHSSNPFHGTSLGAIAQGIHDVVSHPPKPNLSDAVRRTLHLLAPYITNAPMKDWIADIDAHQEEILAWYMQHESLYHQVSTTIAPTMIQGGSPAGNVMPQDMKAVINFRLSPPDTPETVLSHYRSILQADVAIDSVQAISASVPSELDSYGYPKLKEVLEHYFAPLIFIPAQNRGATDARFYEQICRCVMRFGPFLEEEDLSAEGVHGTNERISIRAYLQGIRVLIRMMENTCIL